MGKIVMTLLVRRRPQENADCPFAVQITLPRKMSPGEMTSLTSARLIHKEGFRSLSPRPWTRIARKNGARPITPSRRNSCFDSAATRDPGIASCAASAAASTTIPAPWDKETNNGQVWAEIEELKKEWTTKGKMRQLCEEEEERRVEDAFCGNGRFNRRLDPTSGELRQPHGSLLER